METTSERVEEIRNSAGLFQLDQELADLESKAADNALWDDRSKAQQVLVALTDVKDKIKMLTDFKTQVVYIACNLIFREYSISFAKVTYVDIYGSPKLKESKIIVNDK